MYEVLLWNVLIFIDDRLYYFSQTVKYKFKFVSGIFYTMRYSTHAHTYTLYIQVCVSVVFLISYILSI